MTLVGPGVAVAPVAPSAVGEGVGVRVPWVGPAVGLGPGVVVRVGVAPLPPVAATPMPGVGVGVVVAVVAGVAVRVGAPLATWALLPEGWFAEGNSALTWPG